MDLPLPTSILQNHTVLLDYLRTLLEPAVFNAFTVNAHCSSVDLSKHARYTKRRPPAVVLPTKPPAPSSLPPVHAWPQVVPQHVIVDCCRNYFNGTIWTKPQTCAVCARARTGAKPKLLLLPFTDGSLPLLNVLHIPATSPLHDTDPFLFQHPALNNIMLTSDGIHSVEGGVKICVCYDCYTPLSATPSRVPKFALKNNLYRGSLPFHLADLTWVEEQVCALYRSTALVTRLYGSDDPCQPHVFRGNTCAFAQNTLSTAKKLPRTPSDVSDMLSVVFTGPSEKVPESCLKHVFRVRKQKILDFLDFLRHHNILYNDIELDYSILDLYPVDGALPGVDDHVIANSVNNSRELFDEESASFEPHPSSQLYDSGTTATEHSPHVFLENTGVFDNESSNVPARMLTTSAIRNLVRKNPGAPDLLLHRAENPEPEYGNPRLFPGMFPTLFPFGTGGFDDDLRPVPINFRSQAEYFLDLADHSFRAHRCFIFHALNIHQRRTVHLWSGLTVRKARYNAIAPILTSVDPQLIDSVGNHIANEGKISDLSPEQKKVLTLMREVNTIGANIPGSSASKLKCRNEIRSYMGHFGLPHLFLTLNPAASHSPVFQAIWGDEAVDLTQRFPDIVASHERAIRVASDPVAGADFFAFMIEQFFTHMLGWDHERCSSSSVGGIFGRVRAYYGTAEFTERGQLHGHFLIWLDGGLNPGEVHARMKQDSEWQDQFFRFFEDIIRHHLPDSDDEPQPDRELRAERPPHPDNPLFEQEFSSDYKLLGEQVQRHDNPCRKNVCFKYGSKECRFGFPHEIVQSSSFDEKRNSIMLKCLDPLVNFHNPWILGFLRHNHDLKCILSGKTAKAAMFYISDYITKNDEKMSQVLSMLSSAVAAVPAAGSKKTTTQQARVLLHKCLAARIRAQNIHAQQAARYLRGEGDKMSSHTTLNMMSSAIISYVTQTLPDATSPPDGADPPLPDGDTGPRNSSDGEFEDAEIKIRVDKRGMLYECSQVDDYIHRDDRLAHVSFYDFVRCYRKQAQHNTANVGRLRRFSLLPPHCEATSHILIEFADPLAERPGVEHVPRVVGCSIPRQTGNEAYYATFMLAHFVPFSHRNPLTLHNSSIVDTFARVALSKRSQDVMHNWEALHECEDEREAERLNRHSSKLHDAKQRTQAVKSMLPAEYVHEPGAFTLAEEDFSRLSIDNETLHLRCALLNADWLQADFTVPPSQHIIDASRLDANTKLWQSHINQQVATIANARRALLDPSHQAALLPVHDTQSASEGIVVNTSDDGGKGSDIPETRTLDPGSLTTDNWEKDDDDRTRRHRQDPRHQCPL